eukprot:TRINITY_DN147_c0_g1_i1.p1 TRINITY_DN147_c0_g1~~TRINITY_DN147_c0_g1_i1.p1  ORF type:complete len:208 (-),score=53.35 TRINITY_DN147_c0_g1_i1:22-645(-)
MTQDYRKKFMIAVDGSPCALAAFEEALDLMNKKDDHLTVVYAFEYQVQPTVFMPGYIPPSIIQTANDEGIREGKKLLRNFGRRARAAGVKNYLLVVLSGSHVGGLIVKRAETDGIDYLILGRRGLNRFKRFFMGSTSKYCVEHASCNVLVVKQHFETEHHDQLEKVTKMEEEERERRIKEYAEKQKKAAAENKEDDEIEHISDDLNK